MSSTFKTLFYIRKNYLNKKKKAPIMIRVTINGKMVQFNSKLDIEPELWNPKKQEATGNGSQAKKFNSLLANIRYSIQNHFHEISLEETPTPEKVRDSFLGITDKQTTLMVLFQRHLDNLKNIVGKGMAKATYDKYEITFRRVKEFMKSRYNIPDIPLRDIKNIFVVDFENFLIQRYDYGKNTRAKFLQRFHSVLLIAKRNNWIRNDPFSNFVIGSQKVDRGYLTQAEVDAIWNKELNVTRLEKVRDAFIFACYTGLAYIDVCHLKQHNIVTINGERWIQTRRQKTDTLVEVPLLKIPELIIEKYKGRVPGDALIPISTNQKVNAYLKEIADLCAIQKNLSYHLARHYELSLSLNLNSLQRFIS